MSAIDASDDQGADHGRLAARVVTHSRSQWWAGSLWNTGCQYMVSAIGRSGTGGSSTRSSRRTGVLLTSRSCTNANSEVPGSSHGTRVKLRVDRATGGPQP